MALNLLRIDLGNSVVSRLDVSDEGKQFLGGRGVNHFILLKELPAGIDPLGPSNGVAFGTGLLVGTPYPGANRLNIASLSPITRGLGSGSAGGGISIALRSVGVDHLLLVGKAEHPVYIYIDETGVEIRDASHLWGKDTRETASLIKEEIGHKEVYAACIGPAGERLALNACVILTEGRAVGRCGLGAVLGAKKVKALVARGGGPCGIRGEEFEKHVQKAMKKCTNSGMLESLRTTGTISYGTVEGDPHRLTPYRNFQYTEPHRRFCIDDFECFHVGHSQMPGCPFSCAQRYKICQGRYAGTYVEKLDGNSRADFGERLAVDDAAAILKAHERCQLLGLDVDNTSAAIAWAFECSQRGLLSSKDTDGLLLEWGNEDTVIALIERIGRREGIGDLLADGCRRAAEKLGRGSERLCVDIKGQALMETLRAYKGWALGVVVSERGGGHTRGAPCTEFGAKHARPSDDVWSETVSQKLFGVPNAGDATSYENKADLVVYYERFHAILDSIGVCYFMSNWIDPDLLSPEDIAGAVSSATGKHISGDALMQIGERIVTLGRLFNQIHARFDRKHDYPPARLMDEPVETGPYRGERLERSAWDSMLDDYYRIHGWDVRTGRITHEGLKRLKLTDLKIATDTQFR